MKRKLVNWIQGREQIFEKEIDISELKTILESLDGAININLESGFGNMAFTPQNALGFFDAHLPPRRNWRYVTGTYQLFSGEIDERHYFDFTMTAIRTYVRNTMD